MPARRHLLAYRYRVGFARTFDAPRTPWPMALIREVRELPDVVEAFYPDLASSWVRDRARGADVTTESRRRFVEVVTSSLTPIAADAARDAFLAYLDSLRPVMGAETILVDRIPLDLFTLEGPPVTTGPYATELKPGSLLPGVPIP